MNSHRTAFLPAVAVCALDIGSVCANGISSPRDMALVLEAETAGVAPDPFESAAFVAFSPTGRVTRADPAFRAVSADQDGDGIPDAWEFDHGLSHTNSLDAWEDPDGDGLINLHEYWHGYEPFVADGSNTVLSIIARSVDSRIAGKNPAAALAVYENYMANAATNVFVRNTNCWACGLPFSFQSPWNDSPYHNKKKWHGHQSSTCSLCKTLYTDIGNVAFFFH